jgi:hypothetical protein
MLHHQGHQRQIAAKFLSELIKVSDDKPNVITKSGSVCTQPGKSNRF